jgi:carotenoid cleavage dioxygenase-like enzyme
MGEDQTNQARMPDSKADIGAACCRKPAAAAARCFGRCLLVFEQYGQEPLFRHDLVTGERSVHDFGPGRVPGEFVFVPSHRDAPEGDGWMIGFVIDTDRETTDLVILDAKDRAAEPVARVHIPHRVPPGFHGNWLAD